MGVSADWYDETQSTILFCFYDNWTWEEYFAARRHMWAMQDGVDYLVDHIYDFSDTGKIPSNMLSNFTNAIRTAHANTSGLVVVVSTNALIDALGRAFTNIYRAVTDRFDVYFVRTLDEAEGTLAARRPLHREQLMGN